MLSNLTKEVERDLIDNLTGLLEDAGKAARLYLYQVRHIEPKADPDPPHATNTNKPTRPVRQKRTKPETTEQAPTHKDLSTPL